MESVTSVPLELLYWQNIRVDCCRMAHEETFQPMIRKEFLWKTKPILIENIAQEPRVKKTKYLLWGDNPLETVIGFQKRPVRREKSFHKEWSQGKEEKMASVR